MKEKLQRLIVPLSVWAAFNIVNFVYDNKLTRAALFSFSLVYVGFTIFNLVKFHRKRKAFRNRLQFWKDQIAQAESDGLTAMRNFDVFAVRDAEQRMRLALHRLNMELDQVKQGVSA